MTGDTVFGIVVHGFGFNLNFDDLPIWSGDGGVKTAIAVGFGTGDIVFDSAGERWPKGVDGAQSFVTVFGFFHDDAHGHKVVDFFYVHIMSQEFAIEAADPFGAEVDEERGEIVFVKTFFSEWFDGAKIIFSILVLIFDNLAKPSVFFFVGMGKA